MTFVEMKRAGFNSMSPISSSTCAQLKFDILSITSPAFLGSGLTKYVPRYVHYDEVCGIRKEVADSVDSQNVKSPCPPSIV